MAFPHATEKLYFNHDICLKRALKCQIKQNVQTPTTKPPKPGVIVVLFVSCTSLEYKDNKEAESHFKNLVGNTCISFFLNNAFPL